MSMDSMAIMNNVIGKMGNELFAAENYQDLINAISKTTINLDKATAFLDAKLTQEKKWNTL